MVYHITMEHLKWTLTVLLRPWDTKDYYHIQLNKFILFYATITILVTVSDQLKPLLDIYNADDMAQCVTFPTDNDITYSNFIFVLCSVCSIVSIILTLTVLVTVSRLSKVRRGLQNIILSMFGSLALYVVYMFSLEVLSSCVSRASEVYCIHGFLLRMCSFYGMLVHMSYEGLAEENK